ncbi:transposase family protein [Streptomyces sp. NPDC050121]|uniref:transposase family protein n=1 Tax=Streptomyces sp. NPDC050121 TaxID=3365601 RepID=UPI00379FBE9F
MLRGTDGRGPEVAVHDQAGAVVDVREVRRLPLHHLAGRHPIADGGYRGTGLVIPHRRPAGGELCGWKQEHNHSHKRVRACVEHVLARLKTWKILRDCRLKGDGVYSAMLGIARLHNRALIGGAGFAAR